MGNDVVERDLDKHVKVLREYESDGLDRERSPLETI